MHLGNEKIRATAEELQGAANAPEVHAAALKAAANVLLADPNFTTGGISSPARMATVAMHAAILLRSYLRLVATANVEDAGGG